MFKGKPIIGIVGGIGSGKTYIAQLFGVLGCLVIEADALVREAYEAPSIRDALRKWWGDEVFQADGSVDRSAVAGRIFTKPDDRVRLEGLVHPWVNARREAMQQNAAPATIAFIWDTPLLFETGLNRQCDAVVFVDAPPEARLPRVAKQRGWDAAELQRREILQLPLDKKREISDYVVINTDNAVLDRAAESGDHQCNTRRDSHNDPRSETNTDSDADSNGDTLAQVREILSRIVAGLPRGSSPA
jgi:dephospho-CoA kinase